MALPAILYRNLLEVAADGRGDGTIYAYGDSAIITGNVFDLTDGFTDIDDLGAAADDMFNGYHLVFTASGRSYLITDWDVSEFDATVYETPNAEDVGAFTIRRKLYEKTPDSSYPPQNMVNGFLYSKWKCATSNTSVDIHAAMPNGVDDGGFELNSLATHWTITGAGGTSTCAINSSSPMLGTYDVKFNQGDATYIGIEQVGKIALRVGYTYGIIMKASGDGGAVSDFRVALRHNIGIAGTSTVIGVTWTKINAGDDITSTANHWKPAITDAAAWEEITFTVPAEIPAEGWRFWMQQYDATDVFIDEVYIWEIGPTLDGGVSDQQDTFAMGGHNSPQGLQVASHSHAFRCPLDRTGVVNPAEWGSEIHNLDALTTGYDPLWDEDSAQAVIAPYFRIYLVGLINFTLEAGEIWLGKLWTWEKYPEEPITNKLRKIEAQSATSRGGVTRSEKLYQKMTVSGQQDMVDSSEVNRWLDFIEHSGHGKPFWLRVQTASGLGVTASTQFMRCATVPVIAPDPPTFYTVSFNFEEAK